MPTDVRAATSWDKANKTYQNYLAFINRKADKFSITYIDLLFVRNFKGGNASIHEDETSVNGKLEAYGKALREIAQQFNEKNLADLSENEYQCLKERSLNFLSLTDAHHIDGFQSSYASALLHFYFPNLIPILDRRVLNGAEITTKTNKQGQVIRIERYYYTLFDRCRQYLKQHPQETIRDYDRECFVKPLKKP